MGGIDYQNHLILDGWGVASLCIAAIWTGLLAGGLLVFLAHRKLDFIRMRSPLLLSISLVMIHIYLIIVLLLYPLNAAFGCSQSFWAMSVYFPLGIACWHLSNTHLLKLSQIQAGLMTSYKNPGKTTGAPKFSVRNAVQWYRESCPVTRTSVAVVFCFSLQVVACLIVFLCSRKFHPSFGAFSGRVTPDQCRQGWEWSLSVIVQGVWTWIFGPILLYKIRNIQDIHKLRLQTMLAIAFSLPGLPLWMISGYAKSFHRVNRYWAPSMWFAPGLMMMQFLALFFPLVELYQQRKNCQYRRVKESNVEEESSDPFSSRDTSIDGSSTKKAKSQSFSLQNVIDSEEFLRFAALKDFTAENIIFLRRVRDWKQKYSLLRLEDGTVAETNKITLFADASAIFAETVSLRTAPYPVNIESRYYIDLEKRFASVQVLGQAQVVAPFMNTDDYLEKGGRSDGLTAISTSGNRLSTRLLFDFNDHVFDLAEQSVATLIRQNTWQRFLAYSEKSENTPKTSRKSPFKF